MSQVAACIYRIFFLYLQGNVFKEMSQVASCICKKIRKMVLIFLICLGFIILVLTIKVLG